MLLFVKKENYKIIYNPITENTIILQYVNIVKYYHAIKNYT